MSAKIPDEFLDLFQKPAFGHLATLMRDGTPQVTPVWVDFDGEHILINSRQGRLKNNNMSQRAAVAIDIVDPQNPYRYITIRGRVVAITEDGAAEQLDRLTQRYLNKDHYPWYQPGEVRSIFKILPEHVATRMIQE